MKAGTPIPEAPQAERPGFAAPRASGSRVATRARALLSSTWTLGGLVFVATWGGGAVSPAAGLDNSAHAGLNIAAEQGFEYGRDLIFSYGPLGFLKSYMLFYPGLARLAALYGLLLHFALSLSLVWVARRSFKLPVALALAVVAAALLRGDLSAIAVKDDAGVVVLALIWCVVALGDDPPPWVGRLLVLAGGPLAAIEILAKLNTGIIVLALIGITVLAIERDRRRNVAMLAASLLGPLAILWFASGQGPDNVGSYVSTALELVSGYSSGARLEFGARGYDYFLAPAVVAVALAIAWMSTRFAPPRRRVITLALLALVSFTAFKAGFVSHEGFHMAIFYSTMLGACMAFRLPVRPSVRLGALVGMAGIAAATLTTEFDGYPMTNPIENVRNAASSVATLADGSRLEERIEDGRASMTATYDLDPRSLELLEDRTVHVDPSEVGAAWAYGLDWRPLPVFQAYAAWTQELDRRNAEAIASDDGPERILREDRNPLGHYAGFESPAAKLEMLCHFRALRTTEEWQILGRDGDRCGEPRATDTVEATYGEPVPVPRGSSDSVVFARVNGVQVSGWERVATLLYRAGSRQVSFDPGPVHLLIPGTAADGLLLHAPRRLDFPPPFALAPNPRTVTFLRDFEGAPDPLTIEFFEMPISDA